MRRFTVSMLLALMAISAVTFISCKKSQPGDAAAGSTSATSLGGETTQAKTPPVAEAPVDPASGPKDTAHVDPSGISDIGSSKAAGPTTGDKGVGPIKSVKLGPIDNNLVAQGSQLFAGKCTVCHDLDKKKVGPPLRSITLHHTPEYIMNMILNTDEMEKKDAHVKQLVAQLGTYMSPQGLTEAQARAVLEYLRSVAPTGK